MRFGLLFTVVFVVALKRAVWVFGRSWRLCLVVYLLLVVGPPTFWVFFGSRTAWMFGRTPP
jgi:hypothetical protein